MEKILIDPMKLAENLSVNKLMDEAKISLMDKFPENREEVNDDVVFDYLYIDLESDEEDLTELRPEFHDRFRELYEYYFELIKDARI